MLSSNCTTKRKKVRRNQKKTTYEEEIGESKKVTPCGSKGGLQRGKSVSITKKRGKKRKVG